MTYFAHNCSCRLCAKKTVVFQHFCVCKRMFLGFRSKRLCKYRSKRKKNSRFLCKRIVFLTTILVDEYWKATLFSQFFVRLHRFKRRSIRVFTHSRQPRSRVKHAQILWDFINVSVRLKFENIFLKNRVCLGKRRSTAWMGFHFEFHCFPWKTDFCATHVIDEYVRMIIKRTTFVI